MLSDSLYLENIQEYVQDEDKIVSLLTARRRPYQSNFCRESRAKVHACNLFREGCACI